MKNIEIILFLVVMAVIVYAYGRLEYCRGQLDGLKEAEDIYNEVLKEMKYDKAVLHRNAGLCGPADTHPRAHGAGSEPDRPAKEETEKKG